MIKRKAFTLIELLVVIAIIGILSGMIVLAMNGSTAKARIAKSQVYSNSLRSALMSNVKGNWSLDATGDDTWNHITGTVTGATSNTTDCAQNTCYSFDGGDYILTANTAGQYSILTNGMTAMVWVKGASQAGNTVFANWDSNASYKEAWKIATNGNLLRVILADTTTQATTKNYYSTNDVAFDNTWHLVGFSWTVGGGALTLYIDGTSVAVTKTADGAVASLNANGGSGYAPISIGCDMSNNSAANLFNGSIDNAWLFNGPIPTSQIKELYYAGLNNLLASGKISADEYSQRISTLSLNK
ncbi:MAG TPA: prepilin-type N-terminal cleavage/methylation domain-containing protein [Candidatus Pacearchaeota archaeon]|nr:prepilin-type N-terminal cleavage/methylation domain-containing protein [Candidatus Pacearchaeota archaeon]HPR79747.1 prepilin-type N-terminal cleavage/methylation domain-containing protein [Candidatus Pacearchaeota archaeon]